MVGCGLAALSGNLHVLVNVLPQIIPISSITMLHDRLQTKGLPKL